MGQRNHASGPGKAAQGAPAKARHSSKFPAGPGGAPPFNQRPQTPPLKTQYIFAPAGKASAKGVQPLHTTPTPQALARQTWLHYYNNYLREHQVITNEKWKKMRRLIEKS